MKRNWIPRLLAAVLLVGTACSQYTGSGASRALIKKTFPEATVTVVHHSDGTRGIKVVFEVEKLDDLKQADPAGRAREISRLIAGLDRDKGRLREVTVQYERHLAGKLFTVTSSETVDAATGKVLD